MFYLPDQAFEDSFVRLEGENASMSTEAVDARIRVKVIQLAA